MRVSTAYRKEFIRRVYREADPDSEAGRHAFLDDISDTAQQQVNAGVRRVGASGGGFSSSFATFSGWDPRDVVELVSWARDYVEEDDVDDSLALIVGPIRYFGTDHRLVRL